MLRASELPACPSGDRILVKPEMPETESAGGIAIPETSQHQASFGTLLHAGLAARDQMHDNGHELGDRIWFGQFAGVIAQWDRIIKEGKNPLCAHAEWTRAAPFGVFRTHHFECLECGAKRSQEPILAMKVEDIIANDDLEARMRRGAVRVVRAVDGMGRTQHVIKRKEVSSAAA